MKRNFEWKREIKRYGKEDVVQLPLVGNLWIAVWISSWCEEMTCICKFIRADWLDTLCHSRSSSFRVVSLALKRRPYQNARSPVDFFLIYDGVTLFCSPKQFVSFGAFRARPTSTDGALCDASYTLPPSFSAPNILCRLFKQSRVCTSPA